MTDGSLAEPERQAAPGDEGACRSHPGPRRDECRTLSRRPRTPGRDRCRERLRRRAERVEDGLVAHGASPAPRKSRGRGDKHLCDKRWSQRVRIAGAEPGLDERGPEERPRCTADGGNEPVSDRAQEVPWRCLGGSSARSSSTARNPVERLSPWSPSPRTASSRVSAAAWRSTARRARSRAARRSRGIDSFDRCGRHGRRDWLGSGW